MTKAVWRFLRRFDISDICLWASLVMIWAGCRAVYEPAGNIACGVILLCLSLFWDHMARKAMKGE